MKHSETPTFSINRNVNCVIEIPAGTNKKIELNKTSKTFEVDLRDGKERIINYLPYPANYGFIANTLSDKNFGGDGDALDVLVLSESLPTGTIIECKVIGMLNLFDSGEFDYKVLCIPSDPKLQTMHAETLKQFAEKYPKALEILEAWFGNYDPIDSVKIEGWADEKRALEEINKSLLPLKK